MALFTGLTLWFRCLVPRTPSVLPSSLQTPRAFAMLSDPGRASTPGDCGVSVLPSHDRTSKVPTTRLLSWLNPTARTLTVGASCRSVGRRRKTRFRWFADLAGWALPYPLSVAGESPLRFPSPRALPGATCLPSAWVAPFFTPGPARRKPGSMQPFPRLGRTFTGHQRIAPPGSEHFLRDIWPNLFYPLAHVQAQSSFSAAQCG